MIKSLIKICFINLKLRIDKIINAQRRIIFYCSLILLSIYGCACSVESKIDKPNKKLIIQISGIEFEKLRNSTCEGMPYAGFGYLEKLQSPWIQDIKPDFNQISYNPNDSTLFIKGIVYDGIKDEKRIIADAQIIVGKLPRVPKDSNKVKIDILYNYLVNEHGKFSATFKIYNSLQLIFASREVYNKNGDYKYTIVSYIKSYDIYKLAEMYKPMIQK